MQGRERFFVRAADTNTKENAMQAVLDFINNHVRDIFIPLTALALLRVGMLSLIHISEPTRRS